MEKLKEAESLFAKYEVFQMENAEAGQQALGSGKTEGPINLLEMQVQGINVRNPSKRLLEILQYDRNAPDPWASVKLKSQILYSHTDKYFLFKSMS